MSRADDLHRLRVLSDLVRDARLANLRSIAMARRDTLARLDGLRIRQADETLHPAAADRAQVIYEAWADARRRELIQLLARQSAELSLAEADARLALGRADVIERLSGRCRGGR